VVACPFGLRMELGELRNQFHPSLFHLITPTGMDWDELVACGIHWIILSYLGPVEALGTRGVSKLFAEALGASHAPSAILSSSLDMQAPSMARLRARWADFAQWVGPRGLGAMRKFRLSSTEHGAQRGMFRAVISMLRHVHRLQRVDIELGGSAAGGEIAPLLAAPLQHLRIVAHTPRSAPPAPIDFRHAAHLFRLSEVALRGCKVAVSLPARFPLALLDFSALSQLQRVELAALQLMNEDVSVSGGACLRLPPACVSVVVSQVNLHVVCWTDSSGRADAVSRAQRMENGHELVSPRAIVVRDAPLALSELELGPNPVFLSDMARVLSSARAPSSALRRLRASVVRDRWRCPSPDSDALLSTDEGLARLHVSSVGAVWHCPRLESLNLRLVPRGDGAPLVEFSSGPSGGNPCLPVDLVLCAPLLRELVVDGADCTAPVFLRPQPAALERLEIRNWVSYDTSSVDVVRDIIEELRLVHCLTAGVPPDIEVEGGGDDNSVGDPFGDEKAPTPPPLDVVVAYVPLSSRVFESLARTSALAGRLRSVHLSHASGAAPRALAELVRRCPALETFAAADDMHDNMAHRAHSWFAGPATVDDAVVDALALGCARSLGALLLTGQQLVSGDAIARLLRACEKRVTLRVHDCLGIDPAALTA
jgi:hypothetical protein